jgi:hypothetical protein
MHFENKDEENVVIKTAWNNFIFIDFDEQQKTGCFSHNQGHKIQDKQKMCRKKEINTVYHRSGAQDNQYEYRVHFTQLWWASPMLAPQKIAVIPVYWSDNFNPRMPFQMGLSWYVRCKARILIGQSRSPFQIGMAFGRRKLSPLYYHIIQRP